MIKNLIELNMLSSVLHNKFVICQKYKLQKMNLEPHIQQIDAHGRSQISAMIQSHQDKSQFLTIAHDGLIKLWSLNTMKQIAHTKIRCGYLTSLINYEEGYLVGTGNGEIIKFNQELEREWTKKVHSDCVNDILQTQFHLITIGSDGKVIFMIKPTLTIDNQLDLHIPLTKMTKVAEQIYVAANPSFKIDLNTFELTKLGRSFQFIEHKGKILSCSEEKGLEILKIGQSLKEIHCHFMLPFKNRLITIAEQLIGIIDLERSDETDEEASYSIYRVLNLKKGYSIKAGFSHENWIIVAGEDGKVYRFQFSLQQ